MEAMRDEPTPGETVWTTTTSGEPILCTVVGKEDGQVELDSPAHGYRIMRHAHEVARSAEDLPGDENADRRGRLDGGSDHEG